MDEKNTALLLDEILDQHIELNAQLLQLLKKEREFVIYNDMKRLEETQNNKMTVCHHIDEVEKKRIAVVADFAQQYAFSSPEIKLNDIISVVNEPYKRSYAEKKKLLEKLFSDLKRVNGANKILIENSLRFQEKSFMLIFDLLKGSETYGSTGKVQHNHKRIIDNLA